MIVVDSSALIAILKREPEAGRFNQTIAAAHHCLMSAVNLLEASMAMAMAGRAGDPSSWSTMDAWIVSARMTIVPHDQALADIARHAFLRYGKGRHPAALNMGDCAAYALAKSRELPLLFKGNDFSRTDLVPAAAPA